MSASIDLKVQEIGLLILLRMYERAAVSEDVLYFKKNQIRELLADSSFAFQAKPFIAPGLIKYALDSLAAHQFVLTHDIDVYSVTLHGIETIQQYKRKGPNPLLDLFGMLGGSLDDRALVPASDRLVRLDHNSQPYKAAIKAVDDSIRAVEKANDIGDLTAGERAIVLSQLREGRKLFEAQEVKVSSIRATIEPALRWVLDKAGGTVVGTLVLAALGAIGALVGLPW